MMIKLLPIDYCGTIEELSKWHDEWSCEVFGSIDPSRYYKQAGEGGRYLYGVAEDMSLNEEKATRERVLELLLRIRSINQKLSGMSISQHLQYEEREQMKMERKTLYDEYLELVQPQQDFNSDRLKRLHCCCQKAIKKGYLVKTDGGYRKTEKWTKSLLAYFLTHFLKEDGTFPDKEYSVMFGESRLSKASVQLVNNKTGDGKPCGYEMVDELIENDSKQL